MITGTSLC